jgi:hypothetical protein
MRTVLFMVMAAMIAIVSAIPITPSAPRLQRRVEQFRLEGLKEFEIAERLTSPTIEDEEQDVFLVRLKKNPLFRTPLLLDGETDSSGDIAPGSLDAPQMLPSAVAPEELTLLERLCNLFHGHESTFGYEGKEAEMRRPQGSRHWKQSFGAFRR